ncbi:MAG: VWA domain-containing protein [Planctomycetaceae bacterium]
MSLLVRSDVKPPLLPSDLPARTSSPSLYWGLASSLAAHAGLLVLLGLVVLAASSNGSGRGHVLSVAVQDALDQPLFDEEVDNLSLDAPQSAVTPSHPSVDKPSTASQTLKFAKLDRIVPEMRMLPKSPRTPALATPVVDSASLNQEVGALPVRTGGGQAGAGDAAGNGENGGADGAGKFFGAKTEGNKFVFVVDCSGSMYHPHPGPARNRFLRVRLELFRAISRMTEKQQFFVIFFNQNAHAMPVNGMLTATEENRDAAFEWISQVEPVGDTNPQEALLMAIKLKPDVIYFLTDGDFNPAIVQRVTSSNIGKTVIHTIGFENATTSSIIEELASQNNGTCTLIVPSEDRYWNDTPMPDAPR